MKKIITALLIISAHSVLSAQDWKSTLDNALKKATAQDLYSGQVLIAEDNKIQFHQAYGKKDGKLIDYNTSFKVYSVGKSMTACAILILQQQGRLDVNNTVNQYVPSINSSELKIKHLLNMTSGLPRLLGVLLPEYDTATAYTLKDIPYLLEKYDLQAVDPGHSFHYNNTNYYLLAYILEVVSGESFSDFMDKNIFEPLGMDNSYAKTFELDKVNADNFLMMHGAGSIYTTAHDLFQYDQALYGSEFLTDASKEMMFAPTKMASGEVSNYAFGFRVDESEWGKEISHVGDGVDMRASIQRWPEQKKTLIYLHSESNEYHEGMYWAVRNIWERKPYELPTKRVVYKIDPALYKDYVGQYLSNFGLVHISVENDRLYLRPDAIPGKEELIPSSDSTFYFANQNVEWQFYFENEKVIGFGIKGDKDNMGVKTSEK